MGYEHLKMLHVCCAMATAVLFLLRLGFGLRGVDYRTVSTLRWLPHVIDTVLLVSALMLAAWSGQYPFFQSWLTAKILALPVYIIFASLALDIRRPTRHRLLAGLIASAVLLFIFSAAHTRNPLPLTFQ